MRRRGDREGEGRLEERGGGVWKNKEIERGKEEWGGREERRKRKDEAKKRNSAVCWAQKLSLPRAQLSAVRSLEGEKTIITNPSPLPGVRVDHVSTVI